MELIILIGIPGSGKSSFYKDKFFQTHMRVNLDMLKTRGREEKLLKVCFQAKMRLVIDNANVTVEERKRYINTGKALGYKIYGYFFESGLKECIERNQLREGKQKIPVKGITAKYHQLQPPTLEEGFHKLFKVSIIKKTFQITNWKK